MKQALEKDNLEKFIGLLNQETTERAKLHPMIVPHSTKRIINQAMKNGAIAAKVLGSGGGGSLLLYGNKTKLKNKFKDNAIDFRFDWNGMRWL